MMDNIIPFKPVKTTAQNKPLPAGVSTTVTSLALRKAQSDIRTLYTLSREKDHDNQSLKKLNEELRQENEALKSHNQQLLQELTLMKTKLAAPKTGLMGFFATRSCSISQNNSKNDDVSVNQKSKSFPHKN